MRRFTMFALLPASLVLALASGAAASGSRGDDGDHGGSRGLVTSGPYAIATTDGGSCGQTWAADTIRRTYTVRSNGNGTYAFFETDVGTFATTGPVSPGACETTLPHGNVVAAGIKGVMAGFLTGTVSCTGPCVYNAAGVAACPSAGCFRTVFVAAAFGPTATLATSSFRFDYFSASPLLTYRHWVDQGTATTEQFFGDIATA